MVKLRKSTLPFTKGLAQIRNIFTTSEWQSKQKLFDKTFLENPQGHFIMQMLTRANGILPPFIYFACNRDESITRLLSNIFNLHVCLWLVSYWTSSPLYTMCTQPLLSSETITTILQQDQLTFFEYWAKIRFMCSS